MSENGQNGTEHRRNTDGLKPPWQPGQSGNPKGRPRGTGLTDRLRAILDEEHAGKNVAEALMRAGVKAALEGDYRFWAEILNRIEGKVPDKLVGDAEEAPLRFVLKTQSGEEIDLGDLRAASLNGHADGDGG